MTDTVLVMNDGSRWSPSTSRDIIECATEGCGNLVDTPEEVATYPDGNCPDCGESWTAETKRHTAITVTMPQAMDGGTL